MKHAQKILALANGARTASDKNHESPIAWNTRAQLRDRCFDELRAPKRDACKSLTVLQLLRRPADFSRTTDQDFSPFRSISPPIQRVLCRSSAGVSFVNSDREEKQRFAISTWNTPCVRRAGSFACEPYCPFFYRMEWISLCLACHSLPCFIAVYWPARVVWVHAAGDQEMPSVG